MRDKIWFKAKTYGWGWGAATTWQGWAVYAGYVAVVAWVAFRFPPHRDMPMFLLGTFGATALLIAICALKGEKPAWRWGGR